MRTGRARGPLRGLAALVTALLAAGLALTGCGGSSSANGGSSDGRLRLVFTVTAATLPAWVAQDMGYFKKNGIDVALNSTNDLSSIIPALGRQYDLGVGIQPVTIQAASKGIDVVQVSGGEIMVKKNPTIIVVSRPDSGITSPRDLVGKSLGAPTISGNINYATEYWLQKQGIDTSKITFRQVNTPQMPDQLKAGRLDAAEVQEPYAQVLMGQGYHNVGNPLEAVGEPCYMASWIAAGSWARSHTKEIAAFQKSLSEANQFIAANPDKARDILAKYTGAPADLLKEAPLADFSTENTVETLKQWDPVLRAVGNFKGQVDYQKLVVNP
ncbi:MAG: ABC transporter substrate-binding protein [Pseudonocardia sp.]|nr:ABC transporter substrate-binding protein [Pseudonocardia sp.]